MRGEWRRRKDGSEYQEWRYSVEELQQDVRRFRHSPAQARKQLRSIQHLFDRLLDPKTTDVKRCAIVNHLKRRLIMGFNDIERLAALSKIASEQSG
jgi:hypothetical protein